MGFLQKNELYTNQKVKVSLSKRMIKFIIVNLSRLTPLSFYPNKVYFIYSHHVYDDEFEKFKRSILRLKHKFVFVDMDKAIELSNKRKLKKKYITLSFDDGMHNNLKAAEFLAKEGISSTFFVNPAIVNNSNDYQYIKTHCEERLHIKAIRFFNWEDINRLVKMGHKIGNHGYSHKRLFDCNHRELIEEIEKSKECLLEKVDEEVSTFAWCYGTSKDINNEAIQLIQKGHRSIFSAIRGFQREGVNFHFRDLVIWFDSYHRIEFFYKLNCIKQWK